MGWGACSCIGSRANSASTFHRARWSLIAEKQKAKALGEGEPEPEPAGAGGPEEQEEVGLHYHTSNCGCSSPMIMLYFTSNCVTLQTSNCVVL